MKRPTFNDVFTSEHDIGRARLRKLKADFAKVLESFGPVVTHPPEWLDHLQAPDPSPTKPSLRLVHSRETDNGDSK